MFSDLPPVEERTKEDFSFFVREFPNFPKLPVLKELIIGLPLPDLDFLWELLIPFL